MPVFESSRKVQAFGSSLALTLPALFVKANEIKKGSVMKVIYGLEGVLIAFQVEDDSTLMECLWKILDNLNILMKRKNEEE
jgi:antitoxin component of MazEF toxin-antitoxin module